MIEVAYESETNSIVACIYELSEQDDSSESSLDIEQKRWARLQLDAEIRLTQSASEQADLPGIEDFADESPSIEASMSQQRWSLLVFLPSGGSANFEDVYLTDDHGRQAVLVVEPLTGHVTWNSIDSSPSQDVEELAFEDTNAPMPTLMNVEQPPRQATDSRRSNPEMVYP